jgi:DNA-binding PadR family transcriptional regulator
MREPTFWILTDLAAGPQYGYGIAGEFESLSRGSATLQFGTVYTALDRLVAQRSVEHSGKEVTDGRNRRSYPPTDAGSTALTEQTSPLRARTDVSTAQPRRCGRPGSLGTASVVVLS